VGTVTVRRTKAAAVSLLAALLLAGLAACSSSGPAQPTASLPSGAGLLHRSAAKMRTVTSARFELTGRGAIAGVEVDSAQGVVTSDGRAQGTVKLLQSGSHVELAIVVVGGDIYIKGPTGSYQKLPKGAAGAVFDPSQILDPDRGLAALLQLARDPRTVAAEAVQGVETYKVTAGLDGRLVSHLMPLPATDEVPGTMWVGKASPELDQIMVTVPASGSRQETELTLRLYDFGVQATITPPP
jgi:lipoprotein LprG